MHPVRIFRRLLWVMCAVVLFPPGVAAVTPSLDAETDRDHRLELNARDSGSRLRVGTRTHQHVREIRARDSADPVVAASRHRTDEHDREPSVAADAFAPWALMACAPAAAPAIEKFHAQASRHARACRSLPASDPFAPRPPPLLRSR